MNIVMVIDAYDSTNGGAISTKRISAQLRERGHVVRILTTGAIEQKDRINFKQLYIPFARPIMRKMQVELAHPDRERIAGALVDADVLHIQYPFWLALASVREAKKTGIPVISTFHVQAEHILLNVGIRSRAAIRWLYRYWIRKLYDPSEIVICPSQFAEDEIRAFGCTSRTEVISNGIPDMYQPIGVSRPAALQGKFVVMTVGRLAPEKDQSLIIEAIKKSKHAQNIVLWIFGDGPLKDKLTVLGSRLPNPPMIRILPAEALIRYYNMADLYIHAAGVEVECMSAMEAMACGCPLLISDARKSATKQFALDARSLFRFPDAEDLGNKMDYWIEHEDMRNKARQDYLDQAKAYRIETTVDRVEALYRETTQKLALNTL